MISFIVESVCHDITKLTIDLLKLSMVTTVKPVLSDHSKRWQKLVFKTDKRLMQVKRIAECSKGSILQYFRSALSYHLSLFCLFLSGRLRHGLLYVVLGFMLTLKKSSASWSALALSTLVGSSLLAANWETSRRLKCPLVSLITSFSRSFLYTVRKTRNGEHPVANRKISTQFENQASDVY